MNDFFAGWMTALANGQASVSEQIVAVLIALVVAFMAKLVFTKMVMPLIMKLVAKSATRWDDYILNSKVLRAISNYIPIGVLYGLLPYCISVKDEIYGVASMVLTISSMILSAMVVSKMLQGINDKVQKHDKGARPLTGIFQMLRLVIWVIVLLLVIAVLFDKNPQTLLTGIGASAAVLMLVFQDTIVGLVSGVQLAAYDMIRKDDWVVMEKNGVNGIVVDVNLNTVKVKNWDNSIVTVPPHTLLTDSFKNYRTMQKLKSRRITIQFSIDMNTIRPVDETEVQRLVDKGLYKPIEKGDTLPSKELAVDDSIVTNLHLLTQYMEQYMGGLSYLNRKGLMMVRSEQPTSTGLPIEAYCHVTYTEWRQYEHARMRIMQHILAVMPEFGLKIYQKPSADDLERIVASRNDG